MKPGLTLNAVNKAIADRVSTDVIIQNRVNRVFYFARWCERRRVWTYSGPVPAKDINSHTLPEWLELWKAARFYTLPEWLELW